MKSKTTLILLLVLTVIIWGCIVLKIMNANGDGIIAIHPRTRTSINKVDTDTLTEKKLLLLNYSDPFLRNTSMPQQAGKRVSVSPVKQTSVNWPKITYLGSIGGDKKSRVAMLTIDNKEVFVALNNTLNGIKVSKIYADSVTLVFEKQTKTITIN